MSVTYDKASRRYKAGELMTGQVQWKLKQNDVINGDVLFLQICGISEVKFYDDDNKHLFSNKRYIIRDIIRLNTSNADDTVSNTDQCIDTITDHQHKPNDVSSISNQYKCEMRVPSISFRYQLNEYLPSSYTGMFGTVYYYAQLTKSLKKGHEIGGKVVFTVQAVLDLNRLPEAFKRPYPIIFKFTNKRRQPPFPLALLLERRCFIPGEDLITVEGMLNKGLLRYAQIIKEITFYGHHKGMTKQTSHEEQVIKRVHNLVTYKGQSLLTLPNDLTPSSKCPCCCIVHVGYRLEVAIEYESATYETKIEIVLGTNQLNQKYNGCYSLDQFLEKISKGDRKTPNSTSSLPSYLCPEHDDYDLPERNDYYVSEKSKYVNRKFDQSKMIFLTTSFKTLVSLAVAACFIMPLLGVPAVLLAVLSKSSENEERAYYLLRISYGFAISAFLVCFVLLAAMPGLLLNFFDNF